MRPMRIQRKRTKGWKKPLNTVCVDRTSKWGNPFRVGSLIPNDLYFIATEVLRETQGLTHEMEHTYRLTLDDVLNCYKLYLDLCIASKKLNIEELRNKNLACFCPLTQRCHIEIIFKRLYYTELYPEDDENQVREQLIEEQRRLGNI